MTHSPKTLPSRFSASCLVLTGILFPTIGFAADRTVTTTGDSATPTAGMLRREIALAAPGDRILFAPNLIGKTVTLKAGEITIDKDLTILGPNAAAQCLENQVTISAASKSRIFNISGNIVNGVSIIRVNLTKGNAGSGTGGAINNSAILRLDRVVVSASKAGEGGGVYNGGNLRVDSSSITLNAAGGNGGGISNWGNLEVRQSAIYDNDAGSNGGGVSDTFGTSYYVNSTFALNTAAGSGGGANDDTATVNFTQCTFSQNKAAIGGGMALNTNGVSAVLRNSIVAGNTAGSGPDIYYPGVGSPSVIAISQGINLVGNTSGIVSGGLLAADKKNVAAGLGSLQVNGGLTPTLALQVGSLAIDVGSNANAVDPVTGSALAADQTNEFARIVNSTGTPTATVDIGAYEFLAARLLIDDALAGLEACLPTPGSCSERRINRARSYLAMSIDPSVWATGPNSNWQLSNAGGLAFDFLAIAADALASEIRANGECADDARCALNGMIAAATQLANAALACSPVTNQSLKSKALTYLKKGGASLMDRRYREGFEDYAHAWRYARRACGYALADERTIRERIEAANPSNGDGDDDDQDC